MEKNWFIQIDGRKSGPFSLMQLRINPLFTPDTPVLKKGWTEWVLARDVLELQLVFQDEEIEDDEKKAPPSPSTPLKKGGEIVLDWQGDPPQFYFWLIVSFVLACYLLYHLS